MVITYKTAPRAVKYHVQEFPSQGYFFTTCTYPMARRGSLMFSANSIGMHKNVKDPLHSSGILGTWCQQPYFYRPTGTMETFWTLCWSPSLSQDIFLCTHFRLGPDGSSGECSRSILLRSEIEPMTSCVSWWLQGRLQLSIWIFTRGHLLDLKVSHQLSFNAIFMDAPPPSPHPLNIVHLVHGA